VYEYKAWKYLYPPRPEHVVTSDLLRLYEGRGWVAQYKKNGTCVTVTIAPEGKVTVCDRRGGVLKSWQCTARLKDILRAQVPAQRWTMLVAELMHSKTPTIKDTLYIRDIIVYQDTHLIGTTFTERQLILDALFPREGAESYSHWQLTEGVWRAKVLTSGFEALFLSIKQPKIDEGLVLFDPNGKLKWCVKPTSNESWQVKCRHPTKNYQF